MHYEIRTTEDPETNEQVPLINEKGQVQVRMNIAGRELDQDFDIEDLDMNVKQGLAIFKAELANAPTQGVPTVPDGLIGTTVEVDENDLPDLPEIEAEPEATPEES